MEFDRQTVKQWIEARMGAIYRADPLATYLNAALEGARLALSEAERIVSPDDATKVCKLRKELE